MKIFDFIFPMIDNDDDGPPQLSVETLKALQEWQQEQEQYRAANVPQEDWVSLFFNVVESKI